jgi:hypothetical protein
MFYKYIINLESNIFDKLSTSVKFENIINGRCGTNLIDYSDDLVPLVRTTSVHNKPAQFFLPIHYEIIDNIKKVFTVENLELNNALIEIYDSNYRNMKFHSDQSLDLAPNSYICIFSCYQNPVDSIGIRKLIVKEKDSEKCSEFLLEQNSIIIFSTETNKKYVHKIILSSIGTNSNICNDNKWLGITFRLSKTFIKFIDNIPYFYPTNKILRIANENEKKELMKCKGIENNQIGYNYPVIDYTISIGDILPIINK